MAHRSAEGIMAALCMEIMAIRMAIIPITVQATLDMEIMEEILGIL